MEATTLRRLRGAMGLSQRDLEDLMGLSYGYLSHLETGVVPITRKRAEQVIGIFRERSRGKDETFSIMAGIFGKKVQQ